MDGIVHTKRGVIGGGEIMYVNQGLLPLPGKGGKRKKQCF